MLNQSCRFHVYYNNKCLSLLPVTDWPTELIAHLNPLELKKTFCLLLIIPSRKWAVQTNIQTELRQTARQGLCLYNKINSWPRPIKRSSKQQGVKSSQVQNAILFTLQMRLSYTMYSKMGLAASNSSHLPTKASFPENSSLPSLPTSPLPCSSLSLTLQPPLWARRN